MLLTFSGRYKLSWVYPWIALALILYSSFFFTESTPFPGTAALAPVIGTAIAIASISSWPRLFNFFSDLRLTQWLGEISYPLYLWHWPLLVIPMVYLGRGLTIVERVVAILATVLLAHLTHKFIEQPLRHISLSPKKIVSSAVGATVIATGIGLAISASANNTITLPTGESYSLTQIMAKPDVYQDGCHVNNGETISGDCTYGPESENKVVLFGDSHAAQWMPVLEELAYERNFQLISLTKSACPGPAVAKVESGGYKNADCSEWRKNSIARIQALKPMAVLVSGMQYFEIPDGYASRGNWWREGQARTFTALKGSTQHLIYISDTPHPLRDIPSCLAAGRNDRCNSTEPADAFFTPGWQQINPTSWFCSATCPAILNGVVVYRDSSHISVLASRMVKPQLLSTLLSLGVLS